MNQRIRGYKKWRGQKVHKEAATDGDSLNAIQEGKNGETLNLNYKRLGGGAF